MSFLILSQNLRRMIIRYFREGFFFMGGLCCLVFFIFNAINRNNRCNRISFRWWGAWRLIYLVGLYRISLDWWWEWRLIFGEILWLLFRCCCLGCWWMNMILVLVRGNFLFLLGSGSVRNTNLLREGGRFFL
jgi:hypothetical protein